MNGTCLKQIEITKTRQIKSNSSKITTSSGSTVIFEFYLEVERTRSTTLIASIASFTS